MCCKIKLRQGDYMRKIRRKREKVKKKIIIISAFLFLIIMTSGYAAFSTNISLHAKGNIKIKPVDIGGIEVLPVTEGDGLYEDENESGRYVYRGSNPNNYIMFNNELWRIISKETDGTYKILRNEVLPEKKVFDSPGARTTGYCSKGSAPNNGCNVWSSTASMIGSPSEFTNGTYTGTVDADSEMLTYLNGEYLNSITANKDKITSHDYNIGAAILGNNNLSAQIEGEKAYKWNGNIGLISMSEYLNANSNQEQCGTELNYDNNYTTCKNNDWMFIENSWWTLTPYASYSNYVWNVGSIGDLNLGNENADAYYCVRPAIYLTSNLSLSGSGTESNPYTIVS